LTTKFDVVIVGAGLAGLRAATVLESRDVSVLLVDRNAQVGGRLASHDVDGFIVDEGFQLINPSYPELRATGVLADFDLRRFEPALTLFDGSRTVELVDPRFAPFEALSALRHQLVSPGDLVKLGRIFAEVNLRSVRSLNAQTDCSTIEGFERAGLSRATFENVLQPFLRGTLLDDRLDGSWHYTQLLLRSFTRGRPGTHPEGIVALPVALRDQLKTTTVSLGESAQKVSADRVTTDRETYEARTVIVATDASDAHSLTGVADPQWRSQTTWWFALPRLAHSKRLRIDLGRRFLNSALDISSVAPERAPRTMSLVGAPANGLHPTSEHDRSVAEDVARLYGVTTSEVRLVTKSLVVRALPTIPTPLRLGRVQRRGDLLVAGDYLQTPSIQGALVSGRRAAEAAVLRLGR